MNPKKSRWSGRTVDPDKSYVTQTGMIVLAYTDNGETKIRNLGWDLPTVRRHRLRIRDLEFLMAADEPESDPDGAA